ncbi:ABC transporter ATP-binding protein [Flocculibacter collagenilyticus]|uniref:ABC transporter ATP-binding protein n=1 Tax=Flocculibacter collagenilyticus TaxID=2744479 RepID=UPI0018F35372|nr:ABC transporter ATP-binding protein [Flocculibacter collagenilyticus]
MNNSQHTETLVTLNDINKIFFTDEIETRAISNINLSIKKGEYVSLSGPSGCGKSTLLAILGLLDTPTQGSIMLQNQDVAALNRNQRARIRGQHIGFVFQSFNLISDLTVAENVMLPLTYQTPTLSKKERQQRVDSVLKKVQMQHRKQHFPSQLSGGQQQRVAVARALVNNPDFILADEPTGNLDSKNAAAVMALLDDLHREGCTIVMVTHDEASAKRASRQIDMFDGKIVADNYNTTNLAVSSF